MSWTESAAIATALAPIEKPDRSRSHADSANPLYNWEMYRKYLGPDYHSFTHVGVHFVGREHSSVSIRRSH